MIPEPGQKFPESEHLVRIAKPTLSDHLDDAEKVMSLEIALARALQQLTQEQPDSQPKNSYV